MRRHSRVIERRGRRLLDIVTAVVFFATIMYMGWHFLKAMDAVHGFAGAYRNTPVQSGRPFVVEEF